MATKTQIMTELTSLGDASTKRTHMRHGAQEPCYGVKVQHLKVIQKRVKHDHPLALQLYKTGCMDAQYLASMICEPSQMTKAVLTEWVATANCQMISEYSVAWAAAESPIAWEIGQEWIKSNDPIVVAAGWQTLSCFVAITADDQLKLPAIKKLIQAIPKTIHGKSVRVVYTMNAFLISVGCYVESLTDEAVEIAERLGKVELDLGDNDCKVPVAKDTIEKAIKAGKVGKKRKTAYC